MALAALPPHEPPRWTTSPAHEAKFGFFGAAWEIRTVEIAAIDLRRSRDNQARPDQPVDPELVEQYQLAMLEGSPFPMVVAFAEPDGTYVLADGNHRVPAARGAGLTALDLYVVKVSDPTIRYMLTVSLNQLNGARPSRAQALRQALDVIAQTGQTDKFVAQMMALPESAIRDERAQRRAQARLDGIRRGNVKLARETRAALVAIPNDAALSDAVTLVADAKLTGAQTRELVKAVRTERSESGQVKVVSDYRQRDDVKLRIKNVQESAGGVPTDPVARRRANILGWLSSLERTLTDFPSRMMLGFADEAEHRKATDRLLAIAARFEGLRVS